MSTVPIGLGPASLGREAASVPDGTTWKDISQIVPLVILVTLVLGLVASYFDMFTVCGRAWNTPQYSHAWLIPVFTLVMLYLNREFFRPVPQKERWIGIGILAVGMILKLASGYQYIAVLERLSFIVSIFGLFTLVGGLYLIRKAGAWLGFLIFMYPLPSVLEQKILWWLQGFATKISTFILQLIGFAVFKKGNVIQIEGAEELNVAEACSGLRMATIFIAMAVAIVLLIKDRPWWDKLVILVFSVPIALLVNIIRITATGILYWAFPGNETVKLIAHDGAGYIMPILALGFMWLLLVILEKLSIRDEGELASFGVGGGPKPTVPGI